MKIVSPTRVMLNCGYTRDAAAPEEKATLCGRGDGKRRGPKVAGKRVAAAESVNR
jgi:hypothetical protein